MQSIRTAVVGIGNMGSAHAECIFKGNIKGMTLAAICDNNAERLQSFSAAHPCVKVCGSIDEIVESDGIDAVIIAVPHRLHVDFAEKALEAGASDFNADGDVFEIITEPEDFSAVRDDLEEQGFSFVSAEIEMLPDVYSSIDDPDAAEKMDKLLDLLEDNDDVQNVWHNWDEPDEE